MDTRQLKPVVSIRVETRKIEDVNVIESSKYINHNDSSDRKWLTNHMHWAVRNGRQVTIYPH